MDPGHLRALNLAAVHADYVIAQVRALKLVRETELSPLRDRIYDHALRCLAQMDPDRTPTIDLHADYSQRPTAPPPALPAGVTDSDTTPGWTGPKRRR